MNKIVFIPKYVNTCESAMTKSVSKKNGESNLFLPVLVDQLFLCCLPSWYLKHSNMSEAEVTDGMRTSLAWNRRGGLLKSLGKVHHTLSMLQTQPMCNEKHSQNSSHVPQKGRV